MSGTYLVFGGVGFVGRNLVTYLVNSPAVAHIVVVDKVPPAMAWLNEEHKAAFDSDKVTFKSCNLVHASNFSRITELGVTFDYCINLAGESKYGLSKEVYDERVFQISANCANYANDQKVKMYVEVSTAQVYGTSGKLSTEESKTSPKFDFDASKLKAEKNLEQISGLNYVIVRPVCVYGPGDRIGCIMSQLVIGSVYNYLQETMRLIWSKAMSLNTVHVEDLCLAIAHLISEGQCGEVYNIVDEGDTSIDMICRAVSQVFEIKYEYLGAAMSALAQLSLQDIANDVNEKHMVPWSEMCVRDSIENTPLSPFVYPCQLENLNIKASGDKLMKTGFVLKYPVLSEECLKGILDGYVKQRLFPTPGPKGK